MATPNPYGEHAIRPPAQTAHHITMLLACTYGHLVLPAQTHVLRAVSMAATFPGVDTTTTMEAAQAGAAVVEGLLAAGAGVGVGVGGGGGGGGGGQLVRRLVRKEGRRSHW